MDSPTRSDSDTQEASSDMFASSFGSIDYEGTPYWDSQYSNDSEEGLRHGQRSSSRRHTPQSSQTPTPTTKKRRTANQ
jgi:hypothetical protein